MKKVVVLILDNDAEFAENLKNAVKGLDSKFYEKLDTNICEIEAIPCSDPDEAFGIINNSKIDLFSIDIELDSGREGHKEYQKLFYSGKSIPSIAVSGVVKTKEQELAIKAMGVSEIIHKSKEVSDLDEKFVETICKVLGSPIERILQVRMNVAILKIEYVKLTINGETKSIQQWIQYIVEGNANSTLEEQIKSAIVDECGRNYAMESDHGVGFKKTSLYD